MKKKDLLVENEKNRQDLGFGTKVTNREARLITDNGQFNIRRKGQSFFAWLNAYNRLITMSWTKFVVITFLFYATLNFVFAFIYLLIGVDNEHFSGMNLSSSHSQFWDAFFFSAQTLTTVGYGRIAPVSFSASWVSSLESLLGLMIFAIITGLLYGRFSRPNPRILFSKNALFAPYLDVNALMFRIVNERSNQIINIEVNVVFSRIEEKNGASSRRYYGLTLERSKVNFFPTNWTIVHPITEDSPLFGETAESLAKSDAEILVAIQGVDDTFADTIYTRVSYLHSEMVWGAKFTPMLDSEGDTYFLDLNKIDEYEKTSLNS